MSRVAIPATVRYSYLHVWKVIGGLHLKSGQDPVLLFQSNEGTYSLRQSFGDLCGDADRGRALASLLMTGLFGSEQQGSFSERLDRRSQELRDSRQQQHSDGTFLVFLGYGVVETNASANVRDHGDFVVAFDAVDKTLLRGRYASQHRAMQLALALEGAQGVQFEEVLSSVNLYDEGDRPIHSFSIHGGRPNVICASSIDDETPSRVRSRFSALANRSGAECDLSSCTRLFADLARSGQDPFRAFLSGWTTLVILIRKTFRSHEERFFSAMDFPHQTEMAALFLNRFREIIRKQPNLLDQFALMSSVLLPEQSADQATEDHGRFRRIKKIRDEIAHGNEYDQDNLPVDEIVTLFRKYLRAYVDQVIGDPARQGTGLRLAAESCEVAKRL